MKRIVCVGLGFVVAVMMAIGADAPKDVTAKIESSSASVRYIPCVYKMQASCTFSLNTIAIRVKQPILKLIICYELGDGVRYYAEQYSVSQEQTWSWDHDCKDGIEAVSRLQTEVESSLLRRVTVKSEDLYIFPRVNKGSKVLAARTEVWFEGVMLCNDNSQNNFALLKLGLPEDWYVKGKYPDKIKYKK